MDDSIKGAVLFIGVELKENPVQNKNELIDRASKKFDLNPLQTEFLINKFLY